MVKEKAVGQGHWHSRQARKGLIYTSSKWNMGNIWVERVGGNLNAQFAGEVVERKCVEIQGRGEQVLRLGTGHSRDGKEIIGFDPRHMSAGLAMYFDENGRRKTEDEVFGAGLPDVK